MREGDHLKDPGVDGSIILKMDSAPWSYSLVLLVYILSGLKVKAAFCVFVFLVVISLFTIHQLVFLVEEH